MSALSVAEGTLEESETRWILLPSAYMLILTNEFS